MSQISIIKKSEIDKAKRFDAEYFQPKYDEIIKKIENYRGGFDIVKNVLNFNKKNFFPKENEFYNYVPLSKVSNSGEIEITNKELGRDLPTRARRKVNTGEIILSSIEGSLETSALISKEHDNFIVSNGFYVFNSKKINSETLLVLFKSKIMIEILKRISKGAILGGYDLESLQKIKIPIPPQSFQLRIEKIVKQAHRKQTQSKELYKEAENILLKDLDLLNFKVKHCLTFTTTKKETDKAKRFDSEYFQPKYDEIVKHIENNGGGGFDYLKNLVSWKKGFEVGQEEYLKEGFDFGRVRDFSVNGFENIPKKISRKKFEKLKENFQPNKGEILFTKDGTIGISYLLKENFDGILSSAFLRLNLRKSFEKECLTLILNSILTKLQIEKFSGGAIINHLKPSDFEKIKIPLISQDIQKEISALIEKSHELRKESRELLEEAKRKVEEEIERA